jgi:hypothetical protein
MQKEKMIQTWGTEIVGYLATASPVMLAPVFRPRRLLVGNGTPPEPDSIKNNNPLRALGFVS